MGACRRRPVGAGLAVFPVTLRNYVIGDDLVLVSAQGGANFYIGNGPDARGTRRKPPLPSCQLHAIITAIQL